MPPPAPACAPTSALSTVAFDLAGEANDDVSMIALFARYFVTLISSGMVVYGPKLMPLSCDLPLKSRFVPLECFAA